MPDQPLREGPHLRVLQGGLAEPQTRYAPRGTARSGAITEAWLAHDLILDRPVTLKRLRPDRRDDLRARARFAHEVAVTASLHHPNLTAALDAGEDANGLYLVLQPVAGETLAAHMAGTGPMGAASAVRTAAAIADGLAHAHDRAVVHCGVTPASIVLEAGTGRAILTDFGSATSLEPGAELTGNHAATGTTPEYMAPERSFGRPGSPASDVYSLGVVLYEMLTGAHAARRPLAGDQWVAPMLPPGDLADVPWSLERVILKALAKHPEDRYPTAAAFAADLRRALAGEQAELARLGSRLRQRIAAGRRSRAAAAVYAVSGSAGTYGAVLLLG